LHRVAPAARARRDGARTGFIRSIDRAKLTLAMPLPRRVINMLKPVEKQRVAEEIVEQLRSLILSGQYRVGAKLPPERELAKKLGVNRASLREALKKLEHLGLVRIRQGDGTRVQNFMETAGIELVRHLIPAGETIDPTLTRDIFEFRRFLGRELARLAATRATAADLDALSAIARQAADPELPTTRVFELDFDFYLALTAAARNRVMVLLVNTIRDTVTAYLPLLAHLAVSSRAVIEHQAALIDAITRGAADEAAAIADQYLRRGADHIQQLVDAGRLAPLAPETVS
jgi:DNA-binding FadR family transcriptional regulator